MLCIIVSSLCSSVYPYVSPYVSIQTLNTHTASGGGDKAQLLATNCPETQSVVCLGIAREDQCVGMYIWVGSC